MKSKLCILLIAVQLFFNISVAYAQYYGTGSYNGNWWVSVKDRRVRNTFIAGFLSGMELGYHFSNWDLVGANRECSYRVTRSYNSFKSNYLANVSTSQLADGLNQFYSDLKNRKIKVYDAVWIVLNIISGRPDNEVKEMIENYRKNS